MTLGSVPERQPSRPNLINRIINQFGYRIAAVSAVVGIGLMSTENENIIKAGRTALERFHELAYLLPPVLALKAYENYGISPNVALGSIILLCSAGFAGLTYLERRRANQPRGNL